MRIKTHLLALVLLSATPLFAAQGLVGRYFSGYSVANNRIVFDGLTLVSTQTNTAFDFWNGTSGYNWDPIGPINYSVQWTGFLRVEESGLHGSGTISDTTSAETPVL